jgi:hypothetical protein
LQEGSTIILVHFSAARIFSLANLMDNVVFESSLFYMYG